MNIDELIGGFTQQVRLTRADATARAYRSSMGIFTTYLLSRKIQPTDDVSTLTANVFVDYAFWLIEQYSKKKSLNVHACGATGLLLYATIHDYINFDHHDSTRVTQAFKDIRARREDYLPRMPKRDDVENIKAAVKFIEYPYCEALLRTRNIALICFLASSGCRNNEARGLTVGDIDLQDRQATVTGKGSKQRVVFFDDETAQMLRHYWNIRMFSDAGDPAFARHDKGWENKHRPITTTTVRNIVQMAVKAAGITKGKFTPHYFRHAFATRMLKETGNLALVQDLLGHANSNSTRVYAKIAPEELRMAHREVFG